MNNYLVELKVKTETLKDPLNFIESKTKGKNVLNVGAAGGVNTKEGYLPHNETNWLHSRIIENARNVVGTDIDDEAIKHARKYGYNIINENCEDMKLSQKYEIILMSDVIEHLNAPVIAINNLIDNHLTDDGTLIITTPNGTAANNFIRSISRKNLNIYYDHMAIYYPEHFQAICDRFGYTLKKIYFFDFTDKRTFIIRIKNLIFKLLSIMNPRLSSAIMVLIEK